MNMRHLTLIFLIVFLLVGCKTDDTEPIIPTTGPIQSIQEECASNVQDWPVNTEKNLADDVRLVDHTRTFTGYFDTLLFIRIFLEEGVDPMPIWRCTEAIFKSVHYQGTRYDETDLYTNIYAINQAPNVWHDVDYILYDMLKRSIDFYDVSSGTFNIALGPVIDVWNQTFEACNAGECVKPSLETLMQANQFTNIQGISLDDAQMRVKIEENMLIDLGGIGKGYGATLVGDFLKWHPDVHKFLLNAGSSNIEVYGTHPTRDNGMWLIALVHPDSTDLDPLPPYARVYLRDGENIMSSGDYQRYVFIDGVRYHHLIDPETLFPANTMRAVTVIGPDGTFGDLLATALFILPIDAAIEMINGIEDYEAIFYANDDTVHFSASFESKHLESLLID